MEVPPGAKTNYSYAEALLFVWPKGCSPQTEAKSGKTKENGIFHLGENGPHSSDEGNPYIKANLNTACLKKIANKRGTQITPWAHIYMVFSVAWTGNQQCSVPLFSNFWDTLYKTNTRTKYFTLKFHKIPALVELPAPGQLSEVKSRPPWQCFWANPRGLPGGGMYPVGIDWDISWKTFFGNKQCMKISCGWKFRQWLRNCMEWKWSP